MDDGGCWRLLAAHHYGRLTTRCAFRSSHRTRHGRLQQIIHRRWAWWVLDPDAGASFGSTWSPGVNDSVEPQAWFAVNSVVQVARVPQSCLKVCVVWCRGRQRRLVRPLHDYE